MKDGSTMDKFLGKSAASAGTEAKELGFVAEAGASPRMIDFVMKNGDRVALPYPYLVRVRLLSGAAIEMDFTEWTIKLTGRNLAPLYQHLIAQSARRIQESASGFDDEQRQTSWVEGIAIEQRR